MNSPYANELKLIGEICDTIRARYPSMAIAKIPNERQPVPPKTKLGAPDIFVVAPSNEAVFLAVVLSGVPTEEQRQVHEELRRTDRKITVVSSVEEALEAVDPIAPCTMAVEGNNSMMKSFALLENTSEEDRARLLKSLSPQCYDTVMKDFQQMSDDAIKTEKNAKVAVAHVLLAAVAIVARRQGVSLTEAVEKVNQDPDKYLPRPQKQ